MKKYTQGTIIDVRTPGEFAEDHYPGAVNIPLKEISARIEDIRKMNTPVVAYCRSGNRSGAAVTLLKKLGIREAINGGGLVEMYSAE